MAINVIGKIFTSFKKLFLKNDIISHSELKDFVFAQSAFVSQVTLYTYIKARAGTQHPKLFNNDDFVKSLTIARWHICAACISDLSFYIGANLHNQHNDSKLTGLFIIGLINELMKKLVQNDIDPKYANAIIKKAKSNVKSIDYANIKEGAGAFHSSSDAVIKWAPVVEEFIKLDEEIVRNSIHFRWIGVREEVQARVQFDKIMQQWIENNSDITS